MEIARSFRNLVSPHPSRPEAEDEDDYKPQSDEESNQDDDDLLPLVQDDNAAPAAQFQTPATRRPRRSSPSRSRSSLPKIDYSKLVVLSLTNFRQYKESIKVLGYARDWPDALACPDVDHLQEGYVPSTPKDKAIMKEAYLVIYQTIPSSLKYLVASVKQGDVIGLWDVLYKRFLNVTKKTVKVLKKEWQLLSMNSTKKNLDEFISLVQEKAADLHMVGCTIDQDELADCLLYGLSSDFDFLQSYFCLKDNYTFTDVSTEALKFALNRNMLESKKKSEAPASPSTEQEVCIKFNTTGCSRTKCKRKHEKLPERKLKKLIEKSKKRHDKKSSSAGKESAHTIDKSKIECFKCRKKGHYANECPDKKQDSSKFVFPVFSMKHTANDWILDSGSTQHICNSVDSLHDVRTCSPDVSFTVGNNDIMTPTSVGSVTFGEVTLQNVYLCTDCPVNIVSESRLVQKGCLILKEGSKAVVSFKGTTVLEAPETRSLYLIKTALFNDGLKPIA